VSAIRSEVSVFGKMIGRIGVFFGLNVIGTWINEEFNDASFSTIKLVSEFFA